MPRRYRSSNREIGSLMYRMVYLVLLYLGIKFFGTSILNGVVLALLGIFSFELVGFILRGIGFW